MFTDVLTIETYPTINDHGTAVVDLAGTPSTVTVAGCDAQPGPPIEVNLPRGDIDRISWTVWCPPGTTLDEDQRVRINGGPLHRPVGMPQVWGDTGPLDGPVIYLERWVG